MFRNLNKKLKTVEVCILLVNLFLVVLGVFLVEKLMGNGPYADFIHHNGLMVVDLVTLVFVAFGMAVVFLLVLLRRKG